MKYLFKILILSLFTFSFSEEHTEYLENDINLNTKEIYKLFNSSYVQRGFNLIEYEMFTWNENEWEFDFLLSHTYDNNNNLIEILYSGDLSIKEINSYDSSNNLIEVTVQLWWYGEWVVYGINSYTYDESGNNTGMINESCSFNTTGECTINSQFIYTYDENNNQIEWLFQTFTNDEWINSTRFLYMYNENNQRIESLSQYFVDSVWLVSSRSFYTYNESGYVTIILGENYLSDSNEWEISNQSIYTYDENNNQIEYLTQQFSNDEWNNNFKFSWLYDTNNNLIEFLDQNFEYNEWVNVGLFTNYIYEEYEDNNLSNDYENLSYNLLTSYPNPFNPSTTISFSVPSFDKVSINVYDLKGSLVTTLVDDYYHSGNHTINWDGSDYSSGNYIVKMKSSNYESSQIITLVK